MAYEIAPDAEDDLTDIGLYTIDRWGYDQWVAFYRLLTEAFETIERFPDIGHVVRSNVRSYLYKAHAIRYIINDDGVIIIRVIHVSRDQ
ncbi:MAG: type II toxin-antitoxin system RelE/ParE family toxin [Thermomicrobiales bacterium]